MDIYILSVYNLKLFFARKRISLCIKSKPNKTTTKKALPLGLQSDEEIDIKRGTLTIIEGPERIKCELGKT